MHNGLTNNLSKIRSLLNDDFSSAAGRLETNALFNANAVFYFVDYLDINHQNHDNLLCDFLANCNLFLNDLWLIKDHCSDIMMGYIHYPFIDNKSKLILSNGPITHSNLLTTGFTDSEGENSKQCVFSHEELQKAKNIHFEGSRIIMKFSETSKKPTIFEKHLPRVSIASILTQTARHQNDLGLKISHYCTALESLFATDTSELSHKLAERIAFFLETDQIKRLEVYQQVKNIYKIRSKILHGSPISKIESLKDVSKQADSLLRRIFIILHENHDFDKYFHKNNNADFEKFLTDIIFGKSTLN